MQVTNMTCAFKVDGHANNVSDKQVGYVIKNPVLCLFLWIVNGYLCFIVAQMVTQLFVLYNSILHQHLIALHILGAHNSL